MGFEKNNSKFASEIEKVLLKINLNAHSMLGLYIMPYDTLPYTLGIHANYCAHTRTCFRDQKSKITDIGEAKNAKSTENIDMANPAVDPVPTGHN